MLTTIVCVVSLLSSPGSSQEIRFQFVQSQVDDLVKEFHLDHPTHAHLESAACSHLQATTDEILAAF